MNHFSLINSLTTDNHSIPVYYYPSQKLSTPTTAVQIVHGMSEHHAYYLDLINYLNTRGYDVYIHDQRGHGTSVDNIEDLGFISETNGHEKLISDTIAVTEYIKKNTTGSIYLLGHSMGSLVALAAVIKQCALNKNYYEKLILTGTPGIAPVGQLSFGILLVYFEIFRQKKQNKAISPIGKLLLKYIFNFKFRLKGEQNLFSWITQDQKWLEYYNHDPKSGFIPKNQFWLDIINLLKFTNSLDNINLIDKDIPIILFDGADDPVNRQTKQSNNLYKKLKQSGLSNIKHIIYPNTRHHLAIEFNRDIFFSDLIKELL